MAPPTQPPVLPVRAGDFHRLGLVTDRPPTEVTEWFVRLLGARPNTLDMPAVRGFPRPEQHADDGGDSGATADVVWVGATPVAVFTAAAPDSPVTGFLARYGPGVHSLAWTVDDLWTVESLLRRHGVRLTGTDIEGRHVFMHPKDAAGLLVEWTDTDFAGDPRHGGDTAPAAGAVPVSGLARVTAVVRDVQASAAVLCAMVDADRLGAGADEDGPFLDLAIGGAAGVVVRLASPGGPGSRWAPFLERGGERLATLTWSVDDRDATAERLAAAGIRVTGSAGPVLLTEPADTLGLTMEWTAG
jgi:hypothetical protein